MEDTINDAITNAAIAALANTIGVYRECLRIAGEVEPQPLEYETDRLAGQAILERFGRKVAGELTGYVNWVMVGKHFRDEREGK